MKLKSTRSFITALAAMGALGLCSPGAFGIEAAEVVGTGPLPKNAKRFHVKEVRFSEDTGQLWWSGTLLKNPERSFLQSSPEDIIPAVLRVTRQGKQLEWFLSPKGWRTGNHGDGSLILDGDRAVWLVEREAIYEIGSKSQKPAQLTKAPGVVHGIEGASLAVQGGDVFWLDQEHDGNRQIQRVNRFSGRKSEPIVDTDRRKPKSDLDLATNAIECVGVLDNRVVVLANASPAYKEKGSMLGYFDRSSGDWTIERDPGKVEAAFRRVREGPAQPVVKVVIPIPAGDGGEFEVAVKGGGKDVFTTDQLSGTPHASTRVVGRSGGSALLMVATKGPYLPYLAVVPEKSLPDGK